LSVAVTERSFTLRRVVVGVLAVVTTSCVSDIDTERVAPSRGTIGEEIYKVACQRFAADAYPNDVSGRQSRALCEGATGPEAVPPSEHAGARARLVALAENRARLVEALDRVIPEDLGSPMDRLLVHMIPLYDPPEERLPEATRAAAHLLVTLAEDHEALEALERLAHRQGYRPLRNALGVARPLLRYPDLDRLLDITLAAIDDGGPARRPWEDLLSAGALEMAVDAEDAEEPGPSTLALTRQLLLTERDVFGADTALPLALRDPRGIVLPGGGVRDPFVDTDGDGLADVDGLGRFVDAGGVPLQVPTPFAVLDEPAVHRDSLERAWRQDDTLYYEYGDLDPTFLAGLARELAPLMDPGSGSRPVLLDMARGLPPLLGPETDRTEAYGATVLEHRGPDTRRGALFDVLHGVGVVLDRPETDDALAAFEPLLQHWEPEVAQVIEAALFADALAGRDTRAALVQDAELWDDLIQVFTWVAQEPGLLPDILRAFTDPRSRRLGQIYGEMMRHRDVVGPIEDAPPYEQSNWRRDVVFTDEVDRAAPNIGDNHSILQRSLSMIHDLSGARVCNKPGARMEVRIGSSCTPITGEFDECELLDIPDVAEAYAQAIVGEYELRLESGALQALLDFLGGGADWLLESQSQIDGLTTHPTPEALNRLLYGERNCFVDAIFGDIVTRDGVPVDDRHDTMVPFTWERRYRFRGDALIDPAEGSCADPDVDCVTFYDAMTPLLEVFHAHFPNVGEGPLCGHITPGEPDGKPCYLFAELISALHLHWPHTSDDTTQSSNPSEPFFARKSHGATYEPLVADIFSDCVPDGSGRCADRGARLVTAIHGLAQALATIQLRPGVDGIDALGAAGEVLLDPQRNPGLANLRGREVTSTNAGRRLVPVTPLLLLLDGLNAMDDAFEAAEPARHRRWLDGRGLLVDHLLAASCDPGGACSIDNRRALEAVRVVLPFLRDRIAFHRDQGDLEEWAQTFGRRAGDTLGSPLGSAAIRWIDALQEDPQSREALARFVAYLLADGSPEEAFANTITATADLLQWLEDDHNMDPLLASLSAALAPNARALVEDGGDDPVAIDGSAVDQATRLLRQISGVDDERTLRRVLQNLVALPDAGRLETPLETILDVIAEINRAEARLNEGTHLDPEDYEEVLDRTVDFLTNEHRGLERLYDVIQHRTLEGPGGAP
jgi:hypothetical protein